MDLIKVLQPEDLHLINSLQPEDWPDLRPSFDYYLNKRFCSPVKLERDGKIVAVGANIHHDKTAWLAHIIVHKAYRNQGLGGKITRALIADNEQSNMKSQLLIATDLGYPVYLKQGFEVLTEYVHFEKGENFKPSNISRAIVSYSPKYRQAILDMDLLISGEQRIKVLEETLNTGFLYLSDKRLQGVYLPDLRDGMIIAKNDLAGTELMKLRLLERDQAMLPVNNLSGVQFLRELGFIEKIRVKRMGFGEKLNWKPDLLFNRIGGNLG